MNSNDRIKDLELTAKNVKKIMDGLNKAYIGLTTDEIIKLALKGSKENAEVKTDGDRTTE